MTAIFISFIFSYTLFRKIVNILNHTAQHTALEPKKDMTYAYFENVAVSGMDNYVKVTSHSAGGSEYDEQHFNLYESYTSFWGE